MLPVGQDGGHGPHRTVCRHEARAEIDRALLRGDPHRRIAKRWLLGEAAVQRHKAHIGAPVLAEWSASRRIAAEAREKGNARLELQAAGDTS
jgi:hypothetical protein